MPFSPSRHVRCARMAQCTVYTRHHSCASVRSAAHPGIHPHSGLHEVRDDASDAGAPTRTPVSPTFTSTVSSLNLGAVWDRFSQVDAISELLQVLQHHGKSVLEHSNAPVSSRKAPPTADSASRPSTNHKLSDAQLARLGSAVGSDSSGLTGTSPTAGLAMVTPRDINTPRSPERDASRLGTPLTTPRRVHMELRKPVFTIDIIMDGDELVFSPSPEEFEYQIEDVVGGFVDMISLVERLLNNAELQEFVEVRPGPHPLLEPGLSMVQHTWCRWPLSAPHCLCGNVRRCWVRCSLSSVRYGRAAMRRRARSMRCWAISRNSSRTSSRRYS
jgi:hypothetical protein